MPPFPYRKQYFLYKNPLHHSTKSLICQKIQSSFFQDRTSSSEVLSFRDLSDRRSFAVLANERVQRAAHKISPIIIRASCSAAEKCSPSGPSSAHEAIWKVKRSFFERYRAESPPCWTGPYPASAIPSPLVVLLETKHEVSFLHAGDEKRSGSAGIPSLAPSERQISRRRPRCPSTPLPARHSSIRRL